MKQNSNMIFWLYAVTILGCAFLSFNSQPMLAKEMIPILGGSPMLWNVCMVFFQALLVLGYLYSYMLNSIPSIKLQAIIHSMVLIIACYLLPLELHQSSLVPYESPISWIIYTLGASVGVQFFALTATSNIIMGWASASLPVDKKNDAFKLYAFSNVGSLSGLLLYPFLIEPLLTLAQQKSFWSNIYYFEAGLIICCAMLLIKFATKQLSDAEAGVGADVVEKITLKRKLTWILLAFIPSALFVSTGTYIATDVATIPLLFVIPLAIYLLTFIIAFNGKNKNYKKLFQQQMGMAAFLIPMHTLHNFNTIMIFFNFFNLYFSCLACHTILAGMKPHSKQITSYYLITSIGGVLGGIFSTLIAPLLFDSMIEYPILLVLSLVVVYLASGIREQGKSRFNINLIIMNILIVAFVCSGVLLAISANELFKGAISDLYAAKFKMTGVVLIISAAVWLSSALKKNKKNVKYFIYATMIFPITLAAIYVAKDTANNANDGVIYSKRTFFGIHKVVNNSKYKTDAKGNPIAATLLSNGTTLHGIQSRQGGNDFVLSTYYAALKKPLELYFAEHSTPQNIGLKKAAVIGLGSGTLATIAINHDANMDFYEIDAAVEQIARNSKYFTYLEKCGAKCRVVIGDGRLKIAEHQGRYDLIFLDIFSSDAIPIHTLTLEAFEIYFSKLNEDGIIFINISNRNLDLKPVLSAIIGKLGAYLRQTTYAPPKDEILSTGSEWLAISKNETNLKPFEQLGWTSFANDGAEKLWTDDFSSIFSAISYKKALGIPE